MTTLFLNDGYPLSKLEDEHPGIYRILESNYPGSTLNRDRLRFCGIVCEAGSDPVVFLPYGIVISRFAAPDYNAGRLLMRSVARYGKDNPSRAGHSLSDVDYKGTMFIAVVNELANDFIRNGLYSRRLRKRQVQTGKPDWPRTIKRQTPFFSDKGVPIYPVIETNGFQEANINILASIQADTIVDIASRHGWWTGLGASQTRFLKNIPKLVRDRKLYPAAIRDFMNFLYDDNSLRLARLLRTYWSNYSATGSGSFVCGISDFSTLWEQMLKNLVDDRSGEWNSKLPSPVYKIHNLDDKAPKDRGRMDIVIEATDNIIVADAKYYRALSADSAPGISDLLKQSYYAKSVSDLAPQKPIRSCFVFPSEKGSGPIEYGSFASTLHDQKVAWLEDTHCLYVNTREVMQSYVSRSKLDWFLQLYKNRNE